MLLIYFLGPWLTKLIRDRVSYLMRSGICLCLVALGKVKSISSVDRHSFCSSKARWSFNKYIFNFAFTKVIVNYKYIICQQKLHSIYSNVIIWFILPPFLTQPSQPLLTSPLKLQNLKTPNETLMGVCLQIWHLLLLFIYINLLKGTK